MKFPPLDWISESAAQRTTSLAEWKPNERAFSRRTMSSSAKFMRTVFMRTVLHRFAPRARKIIEHSLKSH
jgi:hypothetical protein